MEVKWIKITTNIFDDDKIRLIEAMPAGDTIIVIWFKLLALAGKSNYGGMMMFNDQIPYTVEMLVTLFRREKATIELALATFERFKMIEVLDGEKILITNWEKHQNVEGMELIREKSRLRVAAFRERLKIEGHVTLQKRYGNADVTTQNKNKNIDLELDKELEKDSFEPFDQAKGLSVSTDDQALENEKIDYKSIGDYWNTHSLLPSISKITDSVFRMIDQAAKSPFLRGENKQEFVASFDWCFKPKNFVKVLEGNYIPKNGGEVSDAARRAQTLKERMSQQ
jgi:predicted phage replisome organizer